MNDGKALEVGDMVRLKCGGRTMVVVQVNNPQFACCVWHDDGGRPCEAHYAEQTLEAIGPRMVDLRPWKGGNPGGIDWIA